MNSNYQDFIEDLKNTCTTLTHKEQQAQIEALHHEVEFLKAKISEKDKTIAFWKKRAKIEANCIQNINSTILQILSAFKSDLDLDDSQNYHKLDLIQQDQDISKQIVNFGREYTFEKFGQSPAVQRLCLQLQSHIDFLSRLNQNPELQSIFLIDNTGKVFLSEQTKLILIEQIRKTSEFISSILETKYPLHYIQNDYFPDSFSDIIDLNKHIDFRQRYKKLKSLLEENEQFEKEEIFSLLTAYSQKSSNLLFGFVHALIASTPEINTLKGVAVVLHSS